MTEILLKEGLSTINQTNHVCLTLLSTILHQRQWCHGYNACGLWCSKSWVRASISYIQKTIALIFASRIHFSRLTFITYEPNHMLFIALTLYFAVQVTNTCVRCVVNSWSILIFNRAYSTGGHVTKQHGVFFLSPYFHRIWIFAFMFWTYSFANVNILYYIYHVN